MDPSGNLIEMQNFACNFKRFMDTPCPQSIHELGLWAWKPLEWGSLSPSLSLARSFFLQNEDAGMDRICEQFKTFIFLRKLFASEVYPPSCPYKCPFQMAFIFGSQERPFGVFISSLEQLTVEDKAPFKEERRL